MVTNIFIAGLMPKLSFVTLSAVLFMRVMRLSKDL